MAGAASGPGDAPRGRAGPGPTGRAPRAAVGVFARRRDGAEGLGGSTARARQAVDRG